MTLQEGKNKHTILFYPNMQIPFLNLLGIFVDACYQKWVCTTLKLNIKQCIVNVGSVKSKNCLLSNDMPT